MSAEALWLSDVSISFGGLTAVKEVTLTFDAAAITGLIGPNGAGKTTLLNAISGFVPVAHGRIAIDSHDMTTLSAAARARLGVVRGFQTVRLLERETVFDNVLAGCERMPQPGLLEQLLALPQQRRARMRDLAATDTILRQLGLLPLAHRPVSELPFASRRLTEIARLLVARPRVLLLDEPAAGLDTRDRHALTEILRAYHAEGDLTMIVIEHDVDLVRRLCPRCVALDLGRIIATGTPAEVLDTPDVRRAYFGTSGHA
jgi:branched-chain amino acid transport system ATP-binding protein